VRKARLLLRRVLRILPASAVALTLGIAAGCQEEPEVIPTKGLKVWIAQSLSGRAVGSLSDTGVPNLTVVFRAGLTSKHKLEIARGVTDADGRFEMLAAGTPQGDAGYWRFIIDEDQPLDANGEITVYCELLTIQGDWVEDYPFELTRRPRTTLPFTSSTFFLYKTLYIPWH
jgi:hypothetical protein